MPSFSQVFACDKEGILSIAALGTVNGYYGLIGVNYYGSITSKAP